MGWSCLGRVGLIGVNERIGGFLGKVNRIIYSLGIGVFFRGFYFVLFTFIVDLDVVEREVTRGF